jgi:replicative DNA helicase
MKVNNNIENLEPIFFSFITNNPTYIYRVPPKNFKNGKIKLIYSKIYDYYIDNKTPHVPSPAKIREMVRVDDVKNEIDDKYLKDILTINLDEYIQNKDDKWLPKRVQSWILYNEIYYDEISNSEKLRLVNPLNFEEVSILNDEIKSRKNNITNSFSDDDNLGLDFDDETAHIQDAISQKITTGYKSIDETLEGGWAYKTFNLILAPSGVGKSIWLANFTVNAANAGKNVVYVSLEMSDRQVMKRVGSMRLKIPIKDYVRLSKDSKYMKGKIKELRNRADAFSTGIENIDDKIGKIFIKEYPIGTATPEDVENYVIKLQQVKKIKIDMIVVDYLTIMRCTGAKGSELHIKGDILSQELRSIAQKLNCVALSAGQTGKTSWEADDINMSDISTSKNIMENCDFCGAIIRTPQMKKDGQYIFKYLKLRDGDMKYDRIDFDFNRTYLNVENDRVRI